MWLFHSHKAVINIQLGAVATLFNGFNCAENFIAFNESTEVFRHGRDPFKPHLYRFNAPNIILAFKENGDVLVADFSSFVQFATFIFGLTYI